MNRLQVEEILVGLAGPSMAAVGLSVLYDGANRDLDNPIRFGLRACGYAIVNPSRPDDDDVGQVTDAAEDQFIDACEIRLLETILNRAVEQVETHVGMGNERHYQQMAQALEKKLARLQSKYEVRYPAPETNGSVAGGKILSGIQPPDARFRRY